ncbi:hypothetical protein M011DRAFT_455110 [Sporormia fimetaria CBS 119925]|uniref:Uncharacterized protein n=1 Tax=Sporormia fimetaria CBS 119925 TaxID=1340428 RepID=A0A6A6VR04_9PLEO|nr:hypothetical protein M011DRAFT_455110 [Sporormia fimetaria CBS 119925]
MAPFRNRDRSHRSGRGQLHADNNVLEGLPITQWREVEVPVGPSPSHGTQTAVDKDAPWPELPMPRDSHLLPLHSQQLLRAARAGRIYKPPAPPEDDRETLDEEDEPKEVQQGFTVKKYVKVPRHLEEPETEYLAKRRKGLPSQYVVEGAGAQPVPLRETKVKKVDAEGNVSVYKALVPEGQTVEAEVKPTEVALVEAAPAAAPPGTVVEGVGVVNAEGVVVFNEAAQQTPSRRKPPPPKKKKRLGGPGRSKKKVVFADGTTDQGTPASGSDLLAVPAIKTESGSADPSDGDTPMADAGDDEEGDEDSDEGTEDAGATPLSAPSAAVPQPPEQNGETPVAPIDASSTTQQPPAISSSDIPQPPASSDPIPVPSGTPPPAPVSNDLLTAPAAAVDPAQDRSTSPDLPLSQTPLNQNNPIPDLSTTTTQSLPIPTTSASPTLIPLTIPPPTTTTTAAPATTRTTPTIPAPTPLEPILPAEPVVTSLETASLPAEVLPPMAPQLAPTPPPAPLDVSTTTTAPSERPSVQEEPEPDLLASLEAHLQSPPPSHS